MKGYRRANGGGNGAAHLTARLMEVARDFESVTKAEKDKYETTIVGLNDKVASLRTTVELEKKRATRQLELIDALQRQVHDYQLVETTQSKESLLTQGKLLKEVESLRAEVMALRFQLLNVSSDSQLGKHFDETTFAQENKDPNEMIAMKGTLSYSARLIDAARHGDLEMVRKILNPGKDVVSRSLEAYQQCLSKALLAAASGDSTDLSNVGDNSDVLNLLLTCGANPFQVDPDSGWNALHCASKSGNEKVLEKILSIGSSKILEHLELPDKQNSRTALHVAAASCQPECVRVLLRNGANIAALDAEGHTAVDLAVQCAAEEFSEQMLPGSSPEDLALVASANEHVREQARLTLEELNDSKALFWSYSVRANKLYGADDVMGAMKAYHQAIQLIERLPEENITSDKNRATLYYNCARACVKVGSHTEAIQRCSTAIDLREGMYPNARAQRAASYMALHDYNHAVQDYQHLVDHEKSGRRSPSTGTEDWAEFLERAKELARKATDFYSVLQVPSTASPAQIKQAFRKQCLLWHPDKHRKSEDDMIRASIKFKQINEANEVLSDEQKRRAYDITRISKKAEHLSEEYMYKATEPAKRYRWEGHAGNNFPKPDMSEFFRSRYGQKVDEESLSSMSEDDGDIGYGEEDDSFGPDVDEEEDEEEIFAEPRKNPFSWRRN